MGDGITTTSARPTIDSVVIKSAYRVLASDPTLLESTNDLTTEIYTDYAKVENNNLNYGYFMIDVKWGMSNMMIGRDSITTNINAIISRYFSQGSYTTYQSDDSFDYIHRGSPLYLNNVKVKILDNNRNLASDISDDNALFIRIVKPEMKMIMNK